MIETLIVLTVVVFVCVFVFGLVAGLRGPLPLPQSPPPAPLLMNKPMAHAVYLMVKALYDLEKERQPDREWPDV